MFQPAGVMIQIAVAESVPSGSARCVVPRPQESNANPRIHLRCAHRRRMGSRTSRIRRPRRSGNARCLGDLRAAGPSDRQHRSRRVDGGTPPVPCTVRADDTVRAVWTVEEVRESASRPGSGIVRLSITVTNEHGDTVQDRYDVLMVNKRPIPTQLLLTHNTYGPRPVRGVSHS